MKNLNKIEIWAGIVCILLAILTFTSFSLLVSLFLMVFSLYFFFHLFRKKYIWFIVVLGLALVAALWLDISIRNCFFTYTTTEPGYCDRFDRITGL